MTGYLPRRLRKRRVMAPEYVITLPGHVTQEMAEQVKQAWLAAGRQGVAVVSEGMRIERLWKD